MPYQLCSSWTNPLARVQQRKTILMISEMLESQVGSEGYVHVWKSKYIYIIILICNYLYIATQTWWYQTCVPGVIICYLFGQVVVEIKWNHQLNEEVLNNSQVPRMGCRTGQLDSLRASNGVPNVPAMQISCESPTTRYGMAIYTVFKVHGRVAFVGSSSYTTCQL